MIISGCKKISESGFVDFQYSFKDFAALVTELLKESSFKPAENKDDLPLFSLAEFAELGVRRCAQNVLALHAIMFDIDQGTEEDLRPALDVIGDYGHFLYTTFSHSPAQLKWRIIVRTSRPVDITEWRGFWQRAVQFCKLEGLLDKKCSDAAHIYYVPGGDRKKYWTESNATGPGLNVDEVLALPLPAGVVDENSLVQTVPEEERRAITEPDRLRWEERLQKLVGAIGARPYPGTLYDLKSHAVFGLARGVPHIMAEEKLRAEIAAALERRYLDHPGAEADRQKSLQQVDKAIADGKAKPYYPLQIDTINTHPLTGFGLAWRLLDQHAENLCYEPAWKKWLVWNEQIWDEEAGDALVQEKMKDTITRILEEIDAHAHDYLVAQDTFEQLQGDPDVSEEERLKAETTYEIQKKIVEDIRKFALKSQERPRVRDSVVLASSDQRVLTSHTLFNRNPYLLNFANGTVDLRTGRLQPHNQKDYLTQIIKYDYDPAATCPRFDKFLSECHPPAVVAYLWRLLGYSVVGVTDEQIIVLNIGEGANGKSTFLNLMLELLGQGPKGYGFMANSENLLTDKGGLKHETWRMDMFSKRFVACLEVEEGRSFAESLIKSLTGSDVITGRRMREDNWSYPPTFQLWVAANQLPAIRGTDEAIWRRMKAVPWLTSFKGREDKSVKDRLREEGCGILARIVREAVTWQEEGLTTPPEVAAETLEYRKEQDPLEPFIEQYLEKKPGHFEHRDRIWALYLEYAVTARMQIFHQKKRFYTAFEKHFSAHKDGLGNRGYASVRILTSRERAERSPHNKLNLKPN